MRRNPRRAYDAAGNEIRPPTIADCRSQGDTTARVWCHDCQHGAVISTDHFPTDLPFPDIALHIHCGSCGSKRIGVMKDMEAHYARLEAETGWKAEVKPWPGDGARTAKNPLRADPGGLKCG